MQNDGNKMLVIFVNGRIFVAAYESPASPHVRHNHFCGDFGLRKETVVTNPDPQRSNEPHQNTKPLQAADLVGYNGTALRKSVDKIIQNNDKHNEELENAAERQ